MASSGISRLDPEASRAKRARNAASSAQLLKNHGIEFEEKNNGKHLIVKAFGVVADFWPTTGQYSLRGSGKYKRGVFNLLKDLSQSARKSE